MKKIIMLGSGGHSKVVQDIITTLGSYEIVGYLDDKMKETKIVSGIYYGPIDYAKKISELEPEVSFIISIGKNKIRKNIVNSLNIPNERYAILIHPSAIIGSNVEIEHGTVVMPNVVINVDSKIGKHCIINSSAVVEHDNQIKSFAHISPNVALAGNITVGEGTHVGIGASVIPGKKIGDWTTIGAGAVVISDIPNKCIAVGVPAEIR